MIDSWNPAELNHAIRKLNLSAKLDLVESNAWNLLRLPYFQKYRESNGITFDVKDDGSVVVTGTATANAAFTVKRYNMAFILQAGTYKLKGCPASGSTLTYNMRIGTSTDAGVITWLGYDVGSGFDFVVTTPSIIQITINVASGTAMGTGGKTFRPEIEHVDVPACTKTTAGNYFLKATVDSDGVITYSWEELT